LRKRYLGLLGLPIVMAQCQPACTPATPPATTTTIARGPGGGVPLPPHPTTTIAEATYDWEVYAFCGETPQDIGVEVTNTGTGMLWIDGQGGIVPGLTIDIWWPIFPGNNDTWDPTETMDVIYRRADTGVELATETYALTDVCAL
jgi:hypothetical protein